MSEAVNITHWERRYMQLRALIRTIGAENMVPGHIADYYRQERNHTFFESIYRRLDQEIHATIRNQNTFHYILPPEPRIEDPHIFQSRLHVVDWQALEDHDAEVKREMITRYPHG